MFHLAMLIILIVSSPLVYAAENLITKSSKDNVWWHGQATFIGEVFSPACTLIMEDAWQSVDMGDISLGYLDDSPIIVEKSMTLRLKNCDMEVENSGMPYHKNSMINISFFGVEGKTPDSFYLFGEAKGIELEIYDSQGYKLASSKKNPSLYLDGEYTALDYTLKVVRNGDDISAGSYHALLQFKIDHE
ncbi:type 1 fimbrial protein [Escherichia coli]|uniref:fimbrial protein n=1 Tax=Escherichia coli TaxID=562 RepID=UPI0010CC11E5|nr:type 1 fimbrial protein [Escherichia coli]EFC6562041.1 type 1 fimbrial protein [Escherichia coli]EJL9944098.1 type 1 fimbrial protein [Escherichia coli]EJS0564934.1 type 1 fimbrial protein [Escherichia coli]MDW2641739.1 type 1 fimbrial protein [Escherichia coli]MDZ3906654.1 type 1 fimbrial protein [Escherichia coli]